MHPGLLFFIINKSGEHAQTVVYETDGKFVHSVTDQLK